MAVAIVTALDDGPAEDDGAATATMDAMADHAVAAATVAMVVDVMTVGYLWVFW